MSSSLPILLISTRVTEESSYVEKRSALAYDYVSFFESLGFTLIPIPSNSDNIERYFELEPQGVVLSGGNTVCTRADTVDLPGGIYLERDRVEGALISGAIERRTPILGICRGMQFVNAYLGGSIRHRIGGHVANDHALLSNYSLWKDAAVNSYHDDGLRDEDLADGLDVLARSQDGFVEAFQHQKHPILGLQWHPERQNKAFDSDLIKHFLTTGNIL